LCGAGAHHSGKASDKTHAISKLRRAHSALNSAAASSIVTAPDLLGIGRNPQAKEDSPNNGTAAGSPGMVSVPVDFDWRAYLLQYSDLRAANMRTRAAAEDHYSSKGFMERRTYARFPILLR